MENFSHLKLPSKGEMLLLKYNCLSLERKYSLKQYYLAMKNKMNYTHHLQISATSLWGKDTPLKQKLFLENIHLIYILSFRCKHNQNSFKNVFKQIGQIFLKVQVMNPNVRFLLMCIEHIDLQHINNMNFLLLPCFQLCKEFIKGNVNPMEL